MIEIVGGAAVIGAGFVMGGSVFLGDFDVVSILFDVLGVFFIIRGVVRVLMAKLGAATPPAR